MLRGAKPVLRLQGAGVAGAELEVPGRQPVISPRPDGCCRASLLNITRLAWARVSGRCATIAVAARARGARALRDGVEVSGS